MGGQTEFASTPDRAQAMAWAVWLMAKERPFDYYMKGNRHFIRIQSDNRERPDAWPLPRREV